MFNPPFIRKLLPGTLIEHAMTFLPNNIKIDLLTLQCELEVLYDEFKNKNTMGGLAIVSYELKTALSLVNFFCRLLCASSVTVKII